MWVWFEGADLASWLKSADFRAKLTLNPTSTSKGPWKWDTSISLSLAQFYLFILIYKMEIAIPFSG